MGIVGVGQGGTLATRQRIFERFGPQPVVAETMPAYEPPNGNGSTWPSSDVREQYLAADESVRRVQNGGLLDAARKGIVPVETAVLPGSRLLRDVELQPAPRNGAPVVTASSYDLPEIYVPPTPQPPTRAAAAANGGVIQAGMFGDLFKNPLLLVGIAAAAWFMFGRGR